jgi:hypothetical protein
VTRTSSLNAIAASLAEKPDATALRREAPGSERSDRSARAVPGPPQPRQGSRRARAGSGHRAAAPRNEFAPFDAQCFPCFDKKDSTPVTAGDCCAEISTTYVADGVKTGSALVEHKISASPPKPDIRA